jgi:transcriptional regulator with XRE-family HTH domain
MVSKFIIYGLTDPLSGQLRYIGKSSGGLKRPKQHGMPSRLNKEKGYKVNWIKSLHTMGLTYGVVVIQELDSIEEMDNLERQWINYFKALGCPLTNIALGGTSYTGIFGLMTNEHKKAISKALKGRPFSDIHKKRLSQVQIGRVASEATKLKMSQSRKGKIPYVPTQETKEKLSRINGGSLFKDELGNIYHTLSEASQRLGVSKSSVSSVLNGHRKTVGIHTFERITQSKPLV